MLNIAFCSQIIQRVSQESDFPGRYQGGTWCPDIFFFVSSFQCGSVLKLKMCILSYSLFLSLLAYSATLNKLALRGMDLFLCISFENTGNESLFVGKDWNSFTELSRDPRKGSVGHDLEVLAGLFVKYLKLKEPQDRRKNKISRESCRKVIYGTYWMVVRSGTQKII